MPDEELAKSKKKIKSNNNTNTTNTNILTNSLHKDHQQPSYKAYSVSGPAIYYFGIVDFLQDWTFNKKVERATKIYVFRKDPDGLSVTMPIPYKLRFQKKMEQIFDIDENVNNNVIISSNTNISKNNYSIDNNNQIMIPETNIKQKQANNNISTSSLYNSTNQSSSESSNNFMINNQQKYEENTFEDVNL